jgi:hypothetical protein
VVVVGLTVVAADALVVSSYAAVLFISSPAWAADAASKPAAAAVTNAFVSMADILLCEWRLKAAHATSTRTAAWPLPKLTCL